MAETKPITTANVGETVNAGERRIRTYEEALAAAAEPHWPDQETADAIKLGEYNGDSGEEAKSAPKKREAKPADQPAGYQTR